MRLFRSVPWIAVLLVTGSTAFAQGAGFTNADVPRDNQKGRYLDFERAQLKPFAFSSNGQRLFTLNSAGARVVMLDIASDTILRQIPVGIGGVSLARRPGTEEIWVVDEISSCVSVVKPDSANIIRSIRVGNQPHGIAFTDSGDRAYVTCSGVDRVDVISSASYAVVKSIPIPARDPRGIVWQNGRAWLVSFMSGNNTAPAGTLANPDAISTVKKVTGAGVTPLPDRDLLSIVTHTDPLLDALDLAATRTGIGTTLFNVCPRPGTSELWIPNTNALNDTHNSERNFVAGQVVSNRITIVDTQSALPPVIVDLDALTPTDHKCAQPTSVTFDPSGTRAYVTAYGSDSLAVLDLGAGGQVTWAGVVDLPSRFAYPSGSGPRASILTPDAAKLYVYERVDDAVTAIDPAALPSGGFVQTANLPFGIGFQGVTDEERFGRHLFSNARFSKSQTSSCASCHNDGHTDGLVWDLSGFLDPEGTPDDQLSFPMDFKGPLVTQSVRQMQDQAPYHWRGEKHSINDFQAAFPNLLENQVNGQDAQIGPDFQYLRHYINHLTYPPNPRQSLDRDYTSDELEGARLFMTKPVLGSLTCASCHQLPIGTGGEIVPEVVAGVIHSADVPALRGVADKLTPAFAIGGAFGVRTELGAGLTHGGGIGRLRQAVLRTDPQTGLPLFTLSSQEADSIAAFLRAFDSGLAPAAGYQATAHQGNAATFAQTELAYLKDQAQRGNCDVVYYRSPRVLPSGEAVFQTGCYDVASHSFRTAFSSSTPLPESFLISEAAAGRPVTFLGVPLGMGYTLGLDRDCDGLLDLDELRKGTDPDNDDSDADGFPDGYEVLWGMNPLVPNSSSPDAQPPTIVGPVRLDFATTNTLKFEFETSEVTKVWISYNGGTPVQRLPLGPPSFDKHHDVVLDGLDPNTAIHLQLLLRDPAGNPTLDTSTTFTTRPRLLGDPAFIDHITLSVTSGVPVNLLHGDVALGSGAGAAAAGYVVKGSVYQVNFGGSLVHVASNVQAQTAANGTASFDVPLPAAPPIPGTLIFVVQDVNAPAGAPIYALGLNRVLNSAVTY